MPTKRPGPHVEEHLLGRAGVPLPVIRPIPARALVAGVAVTAFALTLFGFFAEYGRQELVPASIALLGGEARVASTEAASVTAVLVRPGQAVAQGAPLLRLSTDQASRGGTLAGATHAALEQRLAAVRGELALTEQDAEIRRAGLEAQRAALRAALAQAQAEVGFREDVVRRGEADLARRLPLVAQGAVSEAAVDEQRMQVSSAQANVAAARRELATLHSQVGQITSELGALALRAPRVRAEKQKELAELGADLARTTVVAEREIRSPLDGVVASVPVSEGESLTPGQLLAVVAPKGAPLEVALLVPATSVAAVTVGLPLNLRLDAYPFESHGYVEAVVRSIDATHTASTREGMPLVRAYAHIRSVPPRVVLRPGMTGVAAVEVERRPVLAWVLWPLLKNFRG